MWLNWTYIVEIVVQVVLVLDAGVNLGKDVSHQVAPRVQVFRLLAGVSGTGLEKLRQGSLSVAVLVQVSEAAQAAGSPAPAERYPPREALLPLVNVERHRGQQVMGRQRRVRRHLQYVRQLQGESAPVSPGNKVARQKTARGVERLGGRGGKEGLFLVHLHRAEVAVR